MAQSPTWLIDEQRQVHRKKGRYHSEEKLITAANSLLDLCRFLEILMNNISRETPAAAINKTSRPVIDKSTRKLEETLSDIWCDLYLAVENLKVDCRRSGALVRHASVEVINIGVDLEDGQSYPAILRKKFVSHVEMLSAGIADAYKLMPQTPTHVNGRSKSIKNAHSPDASITRRSEAEKKVGVFSEPSYTNVELAREIGVICEAVNELVKKLSNSHLDHSATIGMLKLCAARLKSILSLSYSLKRWELDLHRAHYIFRQAARHLSIDQEMVNQGTPISPANLPYDRMADYICDRFDDTIARVLIKTDSGYARHNFTVRKKSGRIPSQRVLRSPVNSPVRREIAVSQPIHERSPTSVDKRPGTKLLDRTTETPGSMVAIISPPSQIVVSSKLANPNTRVNAGKGDVTNEATKGAPGSGTIGQKRLTQQVTIRRQSGARAATMSVQWQELQKLSEQQRSNKGDV